MRKKRGKTTHTARGKSAGKSAPKSSSKKPKKPSRHRRHAKPGKRHYKPVPPPKLIEEKVMRPPHEMEEEFFIPSPIHRGKYRIPLGLRFLIGYLLFLSVLYLVSFIYGITFPTTMLFGKLMTGTRALVINSVLLLIIFAMIYGFWKRKAYAFDLSIGFFAFAALNAMISLMLFESSEHPMFRRLLLLSFVSLIVLNTVIIWYILHERKYFYAEKFLDRPFQHRDKVFLYMIISFWAVTLLLGITLGVQFYKDTTKIIDRTLVELKGDYYRGMYACEQKSGTERDVCTLVVATALSAQYDAGAGGTAVGMPEYIPALCDGIESDFYRFTCMRSITG